jgi:membrane protein implicated in regulation of membrane protease activity
MRRGIIAVALICAFVVLAAYYQANVTQHLDYPRESEVNANYAKYIGQNVTITGRVVATGAGSFELNGLYGTYTILSSQAVQRGDSVTLVGTLQPGHQLRAVATFVSPWLLGVLVYVRSFIALIVLVVLFFVSWRFDRRAFVIRPRERGRGTHRDGGSE